MLTSIDPSMLSSSSIGARLGLSSSANILQIADVALQVAFLLFLPCFQLFFRLVLTLETSERSFVGSRVKLMARRTNQLNQISNEFSPEQSWTCLIKQIFNVVVQFVTCEYRRFCLILGDPGAVRRAGRKGATKVFKHRRKAPGYRLSPDHFKTVKRKLAPDWAQKMLSIIVRNRRTASPEFFS